MTGAIAVLGGSSPFTIELVDALVDQPDLLPERLVLHGRDRVSLAAVARYAEGRLPGRVLATDALDAALAGVDVVVQQIRYGGLAGRAADARVAAEVGLPADETLGPAGLAAALRTYAGCRNIGRWIRRHCPRAFVINLTNPVGPAVAALRDAGAGAVAGACELPTWTARSAQDIAGRSGDWYYDGFNHRGFVYGAGWLPDLLVALGEDGQVAGISARTIGALAAVPVKHFAVFCGGAAPDHPDRAGQLAELRARALAELARRPTSRPVALRDRAMPWYRDGVLPLLGAARHGGRVVTTTVLRDDVPRESPVDFDGRGGCRPVAQPEPPSPVHGWLELFERHERRIIAAARQPSEQTVGAALAHDPLVPAPAVPALTRLLTEATEDRG